MIEDDIDPDDLSSLFGETDEESKRIDTATCYWLLTYGLIYYILRVKEL